MSEYFEPWFEYQQPIVRQLAFVVASPNIIQALPEQLHTQHTFELHSNDFWKDLYLRYIPRLKFLDQHPEELITFIQQLKSTRLGLRFEYLMWFWLQDAAYHHYQLIGHSIQIIDGKNTLGELDFLLINTQTQEVEHWEVALKYYLAEADYSLSHWYGLNRSDTLERKLKHFTQKQFQFKSALGHTIQKRIAILKGQLFIPINRPETTLPLFVNPYREVGQWGTQLFCSRYYRLNRLEWICPNEITDPIYAAFWCNGLYRNFKTKQHYMYRQPPILSICVKKM